MEMIMELSQDVREDLNDRGWSDDEIKTTDPNKLFDEYCDWNGLGSWGPKLRRVYQELECRP